MMLTHSRYTVRLASEKDIEQIAELLWECMLELYPNRKRNARLVYSFTVARWLKEINKDTVVVLDKDTVVGFITGHYSTFDELLRPYYTVPLIYVKPDRRKGRATYLLYQWLEQHLEKLGVIVETTTLNRTANSHTIKFGAYENGQLMESDKFVLDKE